MDTTELLKFLHILSAFALVTGIIGRNLAGGQAAKAATLAEMKALYDLTARFDRLLVRPGTFAVLIAGLATAWKQSWPILGFIEGSDSDWLLVSLALFASVFLLVPTVFMPRGQAFGAALKEAYASGGITSNLRAAMHDPVVVIAHAYEVAAMIAVTFLMVAKPF